MVFVCVECGVECSYLCEQISPSVLKLSQCEVCEGVIDKYIEYDGILVLLDLLLLRTNVYRHVLFNRRQVGADKRVYTKYSNGTQPIPCSSSSASPSPSFPYFTRRLLIVFMFTFFADTFTLWLHGKNTAGKLNLQVLEKQFMIKSGEVIAQTAAFYLTVTVISVSPLLGVRSLPHLNIALITSSFAKLFAIPSAMWSQNTMLLILSYVLVLVNNMVALRVLSGRRVGAGVAVVVAFIVERTVAGYFGNHFPWSTLDLVQRVAPSSEVVLERVVLMLGQRSASGSAEL